MAGTENGHQLPSTQDSRTPDVAGCAGLETFHVTPCHSRKAALKKTKLSTSNDKERAASTWIHVATS